MHSAQTSATQVAGLAWGLHLLSLKITCHIACSLRYYIPCSVVVHLLRQISVSSLRGYLFFTADSPPEDERFVLTQEYFVNASGFGQGSQLPGFSIVQVYGIGPVIPTLEQPGGK